LEQQIELQVIYARIWGFEKVAFSDGCLIIHCQTFALLCSRVAQLWYFSEIDLNVWKGRAYHCVVTRSVIREGAALFVIFKGCGFFPFRRTDYNASMAGGTAIHHHGVVGVFMSAAKQV
jgi:hypothetical protein